MGKKYLFIYVLIIVLTILISYMCSDDSSPSTSNNNKTTNITTNTTTEAPASTSTEAPASTSTEAPASTTSTSTVVEKDTTPPPDVINFKANADDSKITLEWTETQSPDYAGVMICRQADNCYDMTTADCKAIYVGWKEDVTFDDSFVEIGVTYCYMAYSFDMSGNYSNGVSASATRTDSVTPTADVSPVTATTISSTDIITVTFSETMNPAVLTLSGSMRSDFDWGTWQKTNNINDTLVLTPTSKWTTGNGKTIDIYCEDLGGNSININLSYNIIGGKIYVNVLTGDDSFAGTETKPKKTIQAGINALTGLGLSFVYIAKGTYTENLSLKPGISLYGGYSDTDWAVRDRNLYPTKIIAATSTALSITDSAITTDSIVDGFIINGGFAVTDSKGIQISNCSPTIQYCTIDGGSGTSTAQAIQISASSGGTASPIIQFNTLNGGSNNSSRGININLSTGGSSGYIYAIIQNNAINGGSGSNSHGIRNYSNSNCCSISSYAEPKIYNNTINGGSGSSNSYGIYNNANSYGAARPEIWNNTIDGGTSSSNAYGIFNTVGSGSTSNPTDIRNNNIFTSGTGSNYCMRENTTSADFAVVRNNNFFSCSTAIYRDENSTNVTNITTNVSTVEGTQTLSSWNNISEDISSDLDSDYRYSGDLGTVNFDTGGINLSTYYTVDKDETTRTIEWSIGAYEY